MKKFYVHGWFFAATCSVDLPSQYVSTKCIKVRPRPEKFLGKSTFSDIVAGDQTQYRYQYVMFWLFKKLKKFSEMLVSDGKTILLKVN